MMMSSTPSLKILFLCTAHNSLSQRLALVLQERGHHVTVELALSSDIMIEATTLASPDLIICPFLTKKVPAEVYERYLTLIVHPGPPGDAGPSAIDWALLGDDGTEPDAQKALQAISTNDYVSSGKGRSHWGVTVLQAIEEFDAGPVWAWDQFPICLNGPDAPTKASLYRGAVTKAAVSSCLRAIERVLSVSPAPSFPHINPGITAQPSWALRSITTDQVFQGGKTRTRPLLKPTERAWDPTCHSAAYASRRLRASDSQPGVQSTIFGGKSLYLYGGVIEDNPIPFETNLTAGIVAQRDGAVLLSTADGKGIWITHVRRLKPKEQSVLPPKLPAMVGLRSVPELKLLVDFDAIPIWDLPTFHKVPGTFQEVWIEYEELAGVLKTAFVYSDFYNGAASTTQCQKLLAAIEEALREENKIDALVLMGGGYWNNGIHLGVCSTDIAPESWANINAINDCVRAILEQTRVVTFAAIRGNAAAGGFALATCCDFVLSVENAVINPHYRAVGLYGSEYHTLTWYARAGQENAKSFMLGMLPMSANAAEKLGLVDHVIPAVGDPISQIKSRVIRTLLTSVDGEFRGAPWTRLDPSKQTREHRRVVDSVPLRKQSWLENLPQPLSAYRQQELDFMKLNFTDPRYHRCVSSFTGKAAATTTPLRFALHRRYAKWHGVLNDPEEDINYFSYQNIDLDAVYSELGLASQDEISLVPPPHVSWRPDVFSNDNSRADITRSHSLATTLVNSPPKLFALQTSTKLHRPQLSPDHISTVTTKSLGIDSSQARRLSRVVHRLKSAFVVKPEEVVDQAVEMLNEKVKPNVANRKSLPNTLNRSSSAPKNKPRHQMTCYYGAVDA